MRRNHPRNCWLTRNGVYHPREYGGQSSLSRRRQVPKRRALDSLFVRIFLFQFFHFFHRFSGVYHVFSGKSRVEISTIGGGIYRAYRGSESQPRDVERESAAAFQGSRGGCRERAHLPRQGWSILLLREYLSKVMAIWCLELAMRQELYRSAKITAGCTPPIDGEQTVCR